MKQSKYWLMEAKNLCSEIGSEDGIDPRIIACSVERKQVPALKFKVVRDYQMENSDACSKNN